MKSFLKRVGRLFLPQPARNFIWDLVPKFYNVNTYILKKPLLIKELTKIDRKFIVREIIWTDEEKLIKAHQIRGPKSYRKIPARMNTPEWHGLAVFDTITGDIAYLAWIIDGTIPYFEEFGIKMVKGQFLLKDGFCIPEYRHQGLHTRMEQERINWCVGNGAEEIFIQIHDSNKKGIQSVVNNGYVFYRQNVVISWPLINTYRAFYSFLKNPFRKVIK